MYLNEDPTIELQLYFFFRRSIRSHQEGSEKFLALCTRCTKCYIESLVLYKWNPIHDIFSPLSSFNCCFFFATWSGMYLPPRPEFFSSTESLGALTVQQAGLCCCGTSTRASWDLGCEWDPEREQSFLHGSGTKCLIADWWEVGGFCLGMTKMWLWKKIRCRFASREDMEEKTRLPWVCSFKRMIRQLLMVYTISDFRVSLLQNSYAYNIYIYN